MAASRAGELPGGLLLTPQDLEVLANSPLFRGCPMETIAAMQPLWHRKVFAPGATIITAGQNAETIYLIVEGCVRVFVDGRDGQDVVLGLRGPGEMLGEVGLLEGEKRTANVATAERSVLLWSGIRDVQAHLLSSPVMLTNLGHVLVQRLRLATVQTRVLAGLDVRGRLATQLLALAQEFGVQEEKGTVIPLHLKQSDLANMVGTTRVSVNQTFAAWRRLKIIEINNANRITIVNHGLLERELL